MKLFNSMWILILIFVMYAFDKSAPGVVAVNNSFGYQSVLILNDTLRIDTTGSGAYKKVVVDTSNTIRVNRTSGLVYSFRLWSNGDSITYTESIDCYDDGLDQWLSAGEYAENREQDSIYTFTNTTSTYGRQELRIQTCDKLRFIMSVPAAAGHSDTIYIPNRYMRLSE
jgi:hypothetical protein